MPFLFTVNSILMVIFDRNFQIPDSWKKMKMDAKIPGIKNQMSKLKGVETGRHGAGKWS